MYFIKEPGSILSILTSEEDNIPFISTEYLKSLAAFMIFFLKSSIEKMFLYIMK